MSDLTITLKRMEGSPAELSHFKKGKRFSTVNAATAEVRVMARTCPDSGHLIAYEVSGGNFPHLYGSFVLKPSDRDSLREAVMEQYGIDMDWE